jgi:hypothetical protein
MLPLLKSPDLTILCGRLLAAGMRARADLAEQARARRDAPAAEAAVAAAAGLASWADQVPGAPFADHPFAGPDPAAAPRPPPLTGAGPGPARAGCKPPRWPNAPGSCAPARP